MLSTEPVTIAPPTNSHGVVAVTITFLLMMAAIRAHIRDRRDRHIIKLTCIPIWDSVTQEFINAYVDFNDPSGINLKELFWFNISPNTSLNRDFFEDYIRLGGNQRIKQTYYAIFTSRLDISYIDPDAREHWRGAGRVAGGAYNTVYIKQIPGFDISNWTRLQRQGWTVYTGFGSNEVLITPGQVISISCTAFLGQLDYERRYILSDWVYPQLNR